MVEALEENKLLLGQKYWKVMRYGFCSYHGIVGSKSSCTFKHCWSDESNYIRNQQLIQLPSMYHVTFSSIFQNFLWLRLQDYLHVHFCKVSSDHFGNLLMKTPPMTRRTSGLREGSSYAMRPWRSDVWRDGPRNQCWLLHRKSDVNIVNL